VFVDVSRFIVHVFRTDITFSAPSTPGENLLEVRLVADSIHGLDTSTELTLTVHQK